MKEPMTDHCQRVIAVVQKEAAQLNTLGDLLAQQEAVVIAACELILKTSGRLVCTGVGKAGIIGQKVAATFASTGTPALFLHPTEAMHGDLGMVQANDVVCILSNSGNSDELITLLPSIQRIGCSTIALVGNPHSTIGRQCTHTLSIGDMQEAGPLGLAPSTSTTALLALGDGLALAVQEARRFTPEDYARFHPAGALGRKLMTCAEAMRPRTRIATVHRHTSVQETVASITSKRAGCAVIVDENELVLGIFSDGDFRRSLAEATDPLAILSGSVSDFASMPCTTINETALVEEALRLFADKHFDDLPVVDAKGKLSGILDGQDLAHRGFDLPTPQA